MLQSINQSTPYSSFTTLQRVFFLSWVLFEFRNVMMGKMFLRAENLQKGKEREDDDDAIIRVYFYFIRQS